MIKKLQKRVRKELHHFENQSEILGPNSKMSGDCSGLSGNLNDCEITEGERKTGVLITDLVMGDAE